MFSGELNIQLGYTCNCCCIEKPVLVLSCGECCMICRECLIERVKHGNFSCPCCNINVKDNIIAYFYETHDYDFKTQCLFCENCVNCKNCIGCVNCENCIGCVNCKDCIGCVNCKDCIKCVTCSESYILQKCIACKELSYSYKCISHD